MYRFVGTCLIGVITLMSTVFSQESASDTQVASTSNKISDGSYFQMIAEANNTLAFDIYKNISKTSKSGNIGFAPYSLFNALGIVYGGADGATKVELGNLLSSEKLDESFHEKNDELNKFLTYHPSSFPDDFQLFIANSLWVQSSFPVLPSFFDFVNKYYRGDLRRVDFLKQPETAKAQINRWVKDQTQGKINDLIQNQNLENTRMLIASAFYLRARWQQGFDSRITKNTPFFPQKDRIISIPMMTQTARFNFFEGEDVTLLEIPFIKMKSSELSLAFVIALPQDREGLAMFEEDLNLNKMQTLFSQMRSRQLIATIPKFRLMGNYALQEIIESLGVRQAFTDEADFSNITGSRDLKIGKVLQKTYFNVDEKGVEAAAATSVEMMVTSAREEPIVFRADRPFMYFVVDRFSNTILFMGRLVNPLEN